MMSQLHTWKKLPMVSGIIRKAPTTQTSATRFATTRPAGDDDA